MRLSSPVEVTGSFRGDCHRSVLMMRRQARVSRVMYRRGTAHSPFCSARMAPTRQMMAGLLGRMPTTLMQRLISC